MIERLKPKYIIVDGSIRIGNVEYHRDLSKPGEAPEGGGWWNLSEDKKILSFYGISTDFGGITKERLDEVLSYSSFGERFEKVEVIQYSMRLKFDSPLFDWEAI